MTGAAPGGGVSGGFLEFFILEASDYVEQLDGVLLGGSAAGGPDSEAMQRLARALRGTATMAKIPSFAELASGVERVGRALQDGALQWDPSLGGALVAAIDDLKILLRAVRTWGANEDQLAATRAAELSRYAPARPAATAAPAGAPAAGPGAYLATEASNIAAGLELLTTRAGDADTATNVLRRVRALRGVAGVKEITPLADVLEATEDTARGFESGEEEMSPEARHLLEASAAYLRTLAAAMRGDGGGDVNAPSSARDAFTAALDNWSARASEREKVVPIAELFYGDGAPGLVDESPNPPTSSSHRFRLELVSLGEHLRQVIDAARRGGDTAAVTRARRDVKRALRMLEASAQSFGQTEVTAFIRAHADASDHLDFLGLASLDDLAAVLTAPGTDGERLTARLDAISASRDLSTAIGAGFGSEEPAGSEASSLSAPDITRGTTQPAQTMARPSSPLAIPTPVHPAPVIPAAPAAERAPIEAPAPAIEHPVAPTHPTSGRRNTPVLVQALDAGSAALIDSSIAALDALESRPLVAPVPMPEHDVVPIESLLYRGRAALDRAVEVRDEIRRIGGSPADEALEELFDLLELARAD